MRLVILLAIVSSVACAGMPAKPKGELCTHYASAGVAICNDIPTGHDAPDVIISDTDKWVMFSPQTWQNVMDYIDALKRKAEKTSPGVVSTTPKELAAFKAQAVKLKKKTLQRR